MDEKQWLALVTLIGQMINVVKYQKKPGRSYAEYAKECLRAYFSLIGERGVLAIAERFKEEETIQVAIISSKLIKTKESLIRLIEASSFVENVCQAILSVYAEEDLAKAILAMLKDKKSPYYNKVSTFVMKADYVNVAEKGRIAEDCRFSADVCRSAGNITEQFLKMGEQILEVLSVKEIKQVVAA